VRFVRLNFFVPVPQMRDFDELNTYLLQCGQEDLSRRLRGQTGTKAELLADDRAAFLPLPAVPFVACRNTSTTASSLSLVRFDDNDYSVPVRCAHHPVVVHGDYREVILCAGGRKWRDTGVSGSGNKSALSHCITWRCWSATRCAGSCPATGWLGVTRMFRHAAASPGERAGGRWHTGIHPGVAVAGEAFLG